MSIFSGLSILENVIWLYLGIPFLMFYGFYLSYKSNFFQIMKLPAIFNIFSATLWSKEKIDRGVKPIYLFFAAIGGCIGIGNVIGVCAAVKIGGPGAVFWMWVAAFCGMMVKYAEIFLSVKFRKNDGDKDYIGGPIVYLEKIGGQKFLAKILAVLLCLYGVEIYVFRVVVTSISSTWGVNYNLLVFLLLAMTLGAIYGGLNLVGKINAVAVPLFIVLYSTMSVWVFIQNWSMLPSIFGLIFKSAFSSHAAIGGFAGSSMWLAMSHGVRRACYSGDIGIGYSGTIHASTTEKNPAREAIFGVMSIFIDTFMICTLSVVLILITGTWSTGLNEGEMVIAALSKYFSHVDLIWPVFIFLLGYSTLIAFFASGLKASKSLSKKYGPSLFTLVGSIAFIIFSNIGNENYCLTIMSLIGVSLLIINVYGMWKLSHHINFDIEAEG